MSENKPVNIYTKWVSNISHKVAYFGAVMMLAMMLLTVSDVSLRYFFNSPINGSYEVTELLMILVFAPALAWTAVKGANVKVDLIVNHFPGRTQGIFDSVTCTFCLIVTAVITWFTV